MKEETPTGTRRTPVPEYRITTDPEGTALSPAWGEILADEEDETLTAARYEAEYYGAGRYEHSEGAVTVLPPGYFSGRRMTQAETRERAENAFPNGKGQLFGTDPERHGEESGALRNAIVKECCGMKQMPTGREVIAAVRENRPNDDQKRLIGLLATRFSGRDLFCAYMEGAWSWKELATAIRRAGYGFCANGRWINAFCKQVPG